MSLFCLCLGALAVLVALLDLVAYPILKSIGWSLTGDLQRFTSGDGWLRYFVSTVLDLPILFSDARELSFGTRASFVVYLFDAIFILASAYPLLMLFARKGVLRSS